MSTISIRPYQPSDYPAVFAILREADVYYESIDSEHMMNHVQKTYPGSILVAVRHGTIIGTVSIEPGRIPLIFRLAVKESERKKHIGTTLMHAAERQLHALGYTEVHLVRKDDREDLGQFYTKLGYTEGHEYRWHYKDLTL
ncbi:MAG: GNAT family N-acetyltransferase [Candidatus Pacebacteria bacterium]|nr:GNAT family N-acetyltransferase [Candidatus Paceibacterota bacterium]